MIEANIKHIESSMIMGDKDGKMKRAIEGSKMDIKNHYLRFHHLKF